MGQLVTLRFSEQDGQSAHLLDWRLVFLAIAVSLRFSEQDGSLRIRWIGDLCYWLLLVLNCVCVCVCVRALVFPSAPTAVRGSRSSVGFT